MMRTDADGPACAVNMSGQIVVTLTRRLSDVEAIWRGLTAQSIETPGLSYDFIRFWVKDRKLSETEQCYVVGAVDGHALVLLPLHRKTLYGLTLFTWFPGSNAGCYAPVADYDRLAALGPDMRRALWVTIGQELRRQGGDLVYLRTIPLSVNGHASLFDELGKSLTVETLYRSQYTGWVECDRLQRSKSRRKHDRQQGDRLNAMGRVTFEELRNADDTEAVLNIMFRQRSARFRAMGVRDIFTRDRLTGFYRDIARPDSGIDVRLHVLRLNDEIVAMRYNIVHGDRMFCLISSMSDDPVLQVGSPGKQCLLRVMQTVFDNGIRIFDMGSGFSDEKRHWCNVQMPLRQHYIGLSFRGKLVAMIHQQFQVVRAAIKANKKLRMSIRSVQRLLDRLICRASP